MGFEGISAASRAADLTDHIVLSLVLQGHLIHEPVHAINQRDHVDREVVLDDVPEPP